ncbi:hypothetical protein V2J09_013080 [Rumex salicifolius]
MAALCGRRTLRVSTSPATKAAIANVFGKSSQPVGAAAPTAASAFSQSSSSSRFSLPRLVSSSRLPVQLSSAQSLIPLHSATATALYTSLLSVHSSNWGCLSEESLKARNFMFTENSC